MAGTREKLIELICSTPREIAIGMRKGKSFAAVAKIADHLIANGVTVQECARPIEEWDEDYGDVLWWKFPVEEPPYVGSPLDEKWPGYHTHWTPVLLPLPQPPKEG